MFITAEKGGVARAKGVEEKDRETYGGGEEGLPQWSRP
jgi:hypothetical protein